MRTYSRFNREIKPFFVCVRLNQNKHNLDQSFGKSYKLCSKKKIDETYRSGVVVKSFPFFSKCLFLPSEKPNFQVVFVVAKKKFKLATTRNRIRRYIRESVRLEKQILEEALQEKNIELNLFLTYNGEPELNLLDTQKAIRKLFNKITHEIENQ